MDAADFDPLATGPVTRVVPAEVLSWAIGDDPRTVLVLHDPALAATIAAAGHDVIHHTDSEGVPVTTGRVVDVVVAGALPGDLDQIAGVLRPGGRLALVVSDRDHRIPWARKLDRALGVEPAADPAGPVESSTSFGPLEETEHRSWQPINREGLAALLPTLPAVARCDETERAERIAAALALYDDYGRGMDGMQLPWLHRCYRAQVVEGVRVDPRRAADAVAAGIWVGDDTQPLVGVGSDADDFAKVESPDEGPDTQRADDGPGAFDDTGMLLIDFR